MELVWPLPLSPKVIVQLADFVYIFEMYSAFASHLTCNAVLHQDQQNFGDCLLHSLLDCCCLSRESGYKLTALMYDMHCCYIQIFLGEHSSMYGCAVNCDNVIQFMCLQQLFVKHHPTTNLSQHSWTYQTYLHVQLSCHDVILLMKATRDFSPSVDFGGTQTGSDCLEKVFCNAGGFGAINTGTCNYTLGNRRKAWNFENISNRWQQIDCLQSTLYIVPTLYSKRVVLFQVAFWQLCALLLLLFVPSIMDLYILDWKLKDVLFLCFFCLSACMTATFMFYLLYRIESPTN